ncbi:MAG: agmatine deiminase family protein [Gammaproteobacteria bacterium]|nr:agmatine deiminase family protein [Gammaproteobacteria bacterium]
MRRLPAEWEPQSAVMLTWPHDRSDWRPWLQDTDRVFTALAAQITRYQQLLIICRDDSHRSHIRNLLRASNTAVLNHSHFAIAASNDSWARDHGPITVIDNQQPRLLNFIFNGWGGKYTADLDNQITVSARAQGVFANRQYQSIPLVLEGGSIDSDGHGTLLTTSACLLAPTRNPGLSRNDIEGQLKQHLGCSRVLWLEHGWLAGDDTDSHIDMLARFCSPDTIAFTSCDDHDDPHHTPLQAMRSELKSLRQINGEPYRLLPLPIPRPIYHEGRRLPASYANFLIINRAVLVPTYGDPMDQIALRRLGWAFPGRDIIGIDARPLIRQFGSLHCVTMQLPAGILG